jgi:hypothetical protein
VAAGYRAICRVPSWRMKLRRQEGRPPSPHRHLGRCRRISPAAARQSPGRRLPLALARTADRLGSPQQPQALSACDRLGSLLDGELVRDLALAEVVQLRRARSAQELDRRHRAGRRDLPLYGEGSGRGAQGQEGVRGPDARRHIPQHAGGHPGRCTRKDARPRAHRGTRSTARTSAAPFSLAPVSHWRARSLSLPR